MDHHNSLYIAVVSMVVTASCPLRCPPSCKDQLNQCWSQCDVCGWFCGWQPLCTSFTPTHTSFEYLSLKYTTGNSAIYLHTLVVPPSSLLQFVFTLTSFPVSLPSVNFELFFIGLYLLVCPVYCSHGVYFGNEFCTHLICINFTALSRQRWIDYSGFCKLRLQLFTMNNLAVTSPRYHCLGHTSHNGHTWVGGYILQSWWPMGRFD